MAETQESSLICVWIILVDEKFTWHRRPPTKLRIEKTSDIDDMKWQAVQRLKLPVGPQDIDIIKILDPLPPEPAHSYSLRSGSQQHSLTTAPQTLPDLLACLNKGNKQFVQFPKPMDRVGVHFKDIEDLVQAIVVVPFFESKALTAYP